MNFGKWYSTYSTFRIRKSMAVILVTPFLSLPPLLHWNLLIWFQLTIRCFYNVVGYNYSLYTWRFNKSNLRDRNSHDEKANMENINVLINTSTLPTPWAVVITVRLKWLRIGNTTNKKWNLAMQTFFQLSTAECKLSYDPSTFNATLWKTKLWK